MEPLLVILQKPSDKYNLKSVILYYSSCAITADFCLVGTIQQQVLKIMQDVKSSEAAGIDKLSRKFLKDVAAILAKPISALCNLSVSRGVFSSACKVGKLKPIFKKGKKTGLSEYWPISLLPGISQIIWNVVHVLFFLMKIYYTTTNPTLTYLTDKILKGFDEGLLTWIILICLQKAFVTIDHEILLQKLKAVRFSNGPL